MTVPGWARALGLALALGLGCVVEDDDTCEIASEDISAVARVVDSGWDIRATIDFEVGDRRGRNKPLRLCSTDLLTINGERPTEIVKASRIEYAVALPADGTRSISYVLERDADGDRIGLDVELPPPFEVLAPMDGDVFDPPGGQVIEWEPAVEGGTMQVGMAEEIGGGECLIAVQEGHTYEAEAGVTVPDTGSWTIPAGVLGTMSTMDCTLTYTLARVRLAPYPGTLQRGGRVEARTERYVSVEVLR